jgi:CRP-like cAMP-binding protein
VLSFVKISQNLMSYQNSCLFDGMTFKKMNYLIDIDSQSLQRYNAEVIYGDRPLLANSSVVRYLLSQVFRASLNPFGDECMSITLAQVNPSLSWVDRSEVDAERSLSARSPITFQTFNRREFLPSHYHKGIWQIESGVVRTLTWDLNGTIIPLGFWGKGDIVGYPLSEVSPYQIECLTRVRVNKLSESYVCSREMMLSHICQTQMLLKIVHSGSVEKRLLHFLVWMSKRFGHKLEHGWRLDLRLTHLDIAEALGTTRVTVTRLLGQLQQAGIIQWSRQEQILCGYSEILLQD